MKSTTSSVEPEMTLYEGLQIMRKGRFEDQRGTEICFEIPEFLRLPASNKTWKIAAESNPTTFVEESHRERKRGTNHSSIMSWVVMVTVLATQVVKTSGLGLMAAYWFTVIVNLLECSELVTSPSQPGSYLYLCLSSNNTLPWTWVSHQPSRENIILSQ